MKHLLYLLLLGIVFTGCRDDSFLKKETEPINSKYDQLTYHLKKAQEAADKTVQLIREGQKVMSKDPTDSIKYNRMFDQARKFHQIEFDHTMSAQMLYETLKVTYPKELIQ